MTPSNPSTIRDLVQRNRSYRRFHEDHAIERRTLERLVDLARLSPSAANLQPLRFMISCDPKRNAVIFEHVAWAGYLANWSGPAEGERPSAYIIILGDTQVTGSSGADHGIAAQSMMLGAVEQGLGGCMIGSIRRDELRAALLIPEQYQILLILALGKPKEQVTLETVDVTGSVRYWRDGDGVHHVPKRRLVDILID